MMDRVLREFIREAYGVILLEKKDHHQDICVAVSKLKDALKKRHFIVQIAYAKPNPDKSYANFGTLNVRAEVDRGRGAEMTQNAIAKVVRDVMDKSGLGRYFRGNGASFDGSKVDVEFLLRDKYIERYMTKPAEEDSS